MTKRTFLRVLIGLAAAAAAFVAMTPWLVRRYLPPERLRALASEQARKSLGRDVRIGDVAYGVWGARLEDVAVSENPDFSAGTFVTVGRLVVRPSWAALLRGRVAVKSVSAEDGRLRYADAKAGRSADVSGLSIRVTGFQLSGPFKAAVSLSASGKNAGQPFQAKLSASGVIDLGGADPKAFLADLGKVDLRYAGLSAKGSVRVAGLSPAGVDVNLKIAQDVKKTPPGLPAGFFMPDLHVTGGAVYSGEQVTLTGLSVDAGAAGKIELGGHLSGLPSKPLADLKAKCPAFDLSRLAAVDPDAKDLALQGQGSFQAAVKGPLDKPAISGQARFEGLGATVAGLPLSGFGGTLTFDETSASLPALRGRIADGQLQLTLKVKNYRTRPDVDLQASVDRFDLGRFVDAREAWTKKRSAPTASDAKAPSATGPQSGPAPLPFIMDTRGKILVTDLIHPNIEARNVAVQWNLSGLSSDLSRLNGSARVSSNGGQIHTLSEASKKSKVAKVLLIPLMVVEKIGRLGGLRLFPDFTDASYSDLAGDYSFQNGLMSINDSHLYAGVGKAKAEGHIDLPHEQLAMRVSTQAEQMAAPLELEVGGTFDQPKVKIKAEKLIEQAGKQLLEGPAKQLLQGLFRH